MVSLDKVVNEMRDDMKKAYKRDTNEAWTQPCVAIIKDDDVSFLENARSEEQLVGWLLNFIGPQRIKGIVVGRMMAKYSPTIKDGMGHPVILEKAIIVSGRVFDTEQTYVSITPCKEHKDMRNPEYGEPQKERPFIPGLESPDSIKPIINEVGEVTGFEEMQFKAEQVYDSRRGEKCTLDPIIQGVVEAPRGVEDAY
jgi:hypothetical protein